MIPIRVFISSVQKELAVERMALRDYLQSDPLLCRFFEPFLFEDMPASGQRADQCYLLEVERSDIYLGIFGNEYGVEDENGLSPTHREYNLASKLEKQRLIYLKGTNDAVRHPKMKALVREVDGSLIRRRFNSTEELRTVVYASLVRILEERELLRFSPFDASYCRDAVMDDLDNERIIEFLGLARRGRSFPLPVNSSPEKVLTHMNLLSKGRPTHAAILLFGKKPQRFLLTSEVKCAHFHGTTVCKPIPSYQVYKGTVFDLVEQAKDFVLSKIDLWVGTREHSVRVPTRYEMPQKVVMEAIVNAVAHRDYTSNASVQVMLFADRLEIWNPGVLPPSLTLENIRGPHPSVPGNPLIAEALYLTKYIERMGTGIVDMIARCKKAGVPEPEIRIDGGQFVLTLRRKVKKKIKTISERKIGKNGNNGQSLFRFMSGIETPKEGKIRIETGIETEKEGKIRIETGIETEKEGKIRIEQDKALSDIKRNILIYISQNNAITITELAEKLEMSRSTVADHVNQLKTQYILAREGARKNGRWVIQTKK